MLIIQIFCQVEQLRRANKIWANDNVHLFKILKVPVRKDSQYYTAELEVSDDESGTDDSGINEDKITNNTVVEKGAKLGGSVEKSNKTEADHSSGKGQSNQTPSSFLDQLDARIKSSKQESEKLRSALKIIIY